MKQTRRGKSGTGTLPPRDARFFYLLFYAGDVFFFAETTNTLTPPLDESWSTLPLDLAQLFIIMVMFFLSGGRWRRKKKKRSFVMRVGQENESPLTGAVELMDDVLDSQEKDGLRPLKLNRLRLSDRLLLLLLLPMLVCESDMATRPSSPSMLASSAQPGGVGGGFPAAAAANVWIRSSGVIGGSDMVPTMQRKSIIHQIKKEFPFCIFKKQNKGKIEVDLDRQHSPKLMRLHLVRATWRMA